MQQRLPSLLDRPIAFAHRGARAHARENTLDAFTLGLRLGATGLESDVWLTADGVPVLDHDGVVRSSAGASAAVGTLGRGELPEHIPSLADLLARSVAVDYHLSLDLKDPDAGPAVIDVVRATAPGLLPRLWLCHPRARRARRAAPVRRDGPARRLDPARPDEGGPGAAGGDARRRGHRRRQPAPHATGPAA